MKSHALFDLRRRRTAIAAVLAAVTLVGVLPAIAVGAGNWLVSAALQKQLRREISVVWVGTPLRRALDGLSQTRRVAVLIDRRVDPDQKVDLKLDEVPLGAALRDVARSRDLGVSVVNTVVYFGPPRVARQIRTIAALRTEEVRRLPPTVTRKFLLPGRIAWDDFATPGELLQRLADENRLTLLGLDRVPHDLWAGADLPPLSLVERITLIAIQFDLTFEVSPDGQTVRLVPMPDEVALVRSYPGGSNPQATAKNYAEHLPGSKVKVVDRQIYVKGLLEDHERIATLNRPSQRPVRPSAGNMGTTRISKMSFRNVPVGEVFKFLGQHPKLKLDFRIDQKALDKAGVSLEQRVSVDVKNVSVDELLREVVKNCRLKYVLRGRVVEIGPRQ